MTAVADLVPEKELIAKPGTWRAISTINGLFRLTEMEPFVQSTEINSTDL